MDQPGSELQRFSFGDREIKVCMPAEAERKRLAASAIVANGHYPYWAQVWPAAIALCTVLARSPGLIAGKHVVELAAGLGLPGIYAAGLAKTVIVSDGAGEALAWMRETVIANGCTNVECMVVDWNHMPEGLEAEVLLLSDINYEPSSFEALHQVLVKFLEKGTTLLLASPQRLMAKPFIEQLLGYVVRQEEVMVQTGEKVTAVSVFEMKQ